MLEIIEITIVSVFNSAFGMLALAFVGGLAFIASSTVIQLIGFVVERTIMRSRLGNTYKFINDRVTPAFEKFFGDSDVLLFIYLALVIYHLIGLYNDFPIYLILFFDK